MCSHRSQFPPLGDSEREPGDEVNVLALVKGYERYVFLFRDDQRDECLRTIGRCAANPELSFTWYDAAVLGQKLRDIM